MSAIPGAVEAVADFARLVREFQLLIDKAHPGARHDLLLRCAILLPRIYAAGLTLPDLGHEGEDEELEVTCPLAALTTLLGAHDSYQMVYDPTRDFETVTGSIADDLTDIYLDLVRPLLTYDAGHVADAVWQWKFNVRGHCGEHIVNVMRPLHFLVDDHLPPDQDLTLP